MDYIWIVWAVLAYVTGSMPFGLWLAKTVCGVDPRTTGSRNTGATNIARTCGTRYGVATLVLDMLKGALPVAGALLTGCAVWQVNVVMFLAVLGHVFSLFMGFRGGKAVATTLGVFIPAAFWPLLLSAVLCVAVIKASGFVSLGSLTLVTAMPLALAGFGRFEYLPVALAIMGLVYWRHRENIVRLARGEEKSWRKSKQDAA